MSSSASEFLNRLGMVDTDFYVPESKLDRLMACYAKNPITGEVTLSDGAGADSKPIQNPTQTAERWRRLGLDAA